MAVVARPVVVSLDFLEDARSQVPDVYRDFLEFEEYSWLLDGSVYFSWPPQLVPFCSWADMKFSCFCRNNENDLENVSVYTVDMGGYLEVAPGPYETVLISKYVQTLEEWFEIWLYDEDIDTHKYKAYRSNLSRVRHNHNERWSRIPEKYRANNQKG
jgi:hypothetical protein